MGLLLASQQKINEGRFLKKIFKYFTNLLKPFANIRGMFGKSKDKIIKKNFLDRTSK